MFLAFQRYAISLIILYIALQPAIASEVGSEKEVAKQLIDTESIDELNTRAKNLWSSAPDSLLLLSNRALRASENLGYKKGRVDALTNLGIGFYEKGDYISSIRHYQQAIELVRKSKAKVDLGKLLSNISMPFLALGQHNEAINHLQEALKESKSSNLLATEAHALHNIGMVYHYQGNHSRALEYYTQSSVLYKKIGETSRETFILGNIAHIYLAKKEYKIATEYYLKSLELAKEDNNQKAIGNTLQSIGNLYREKGNARQALHYFYQAKTLLDRTGEGTERLRLINNLSTCYDVLGDVDSALFYGHETFTTARQQQQMYYVQQSSEKLSTLYERKSNYRKALWYAHINKESSDSLHNSEAKINMARMEERYKYQKLDQELKDAHYIELEKKKYSITFISILSVFLLIIVVLLAFGKRSFKKKNAAIKLSMHEIASQKERLEEADNFKGHLISILAHDVRTPISNMVSLLKLSTAGHLSPQSTVELLERSYHEMNSLNIFVNDLLSWIVRQKDDMHTELEFIDILDLLTGIEYLFRRKAVEKGISISLNISKGTQVVADKEMLKIVLRNLLDNAIKFCKNGDHIYVETHQVDAERVKLVIQDTGAGFQMATGFNGISFPDRSESTSAARHTGLGLVLCQQYLKKNGSELFFASEIGIGSSFWFTLRSNNLRS